MLGSRSQQKAPCFYAHRTQSCLELALGSMSVCVGVRQGPGESCLLSALVHLPRAYTLVLVISPWGLDSGFPGPACVLYLYLLLFLGSSGNLRPAQYSASCSQGLLSNRLSGQACSGLHPYSSCLCLKCSGPAWLRAQTFPIGLAGKRFLREAFVGCRLQSCRYGLDAWLG